MAFSAKKVCLREGVPQGGVLSPTLFLVYINDILTTISKMVSNTLHADDLAIWNASEHTTTATYRIQEAISGISKWTLDWGLEINTSKTNSALFSLSTSKEHIKLRWKDEIVPQTDTPTFLGVKLDTRLTWKPQIEKMEKSGLHKLALECRLINSDQSLHSNSTTNHGVCIHYVGNGCQDQQEQAGKSPEHDSSSHTWSHENHSSALHGKKSQCGATWEEKMSQNSHPGRKTEKAAFPPSTHKPGTAHQKSPQTPKPEAPVQRTVQDTSRHCGCANRAADRSCLEARQRGRRTNVSECPRHHLKGTAPLESPETSRLP